MPRDVKARFLGELNTRYGPLSKLPRTESLFDVGDVGLRVYVRYSKLHKESKLHYGFYGLREQDILALYDRPAVLCFLLDEFPEPILLPFGEYRDVFQGLAPAPDGQFKVHIYLRPEGIRLYIAKKGLFNIEGNIGWRSLAQRCITDGVAAPVDMTHYQMQTLIGAIGTFKNYDIWIPPSDRNRLDWSQVTPFPFRSHLPGSLDSIGPILEEVDVLWFDRETEELAALFEVEHTTPIYSGLLRFNDFHLTEPTFKPSFNIVADEPRRELFVRQVHRPTFRASHLYEHCSFLNYQDVIVWHQRLLH